MRCLKGYLLMRLGYSHNLKELFAAFGSNTSVMLMGTINGEPSTIEGVINSMTKEDGSGLNWIVRVAGEDRPILVRTYPYNASLTDEPVIRRRIHQDIVRDTH